MGKWRTTSEWEADSDLAIWAMAELSRVAAKLRRIRQSKGLPAAAVGRTLGISRQEMFVRESGGREHAFHKLQVLALYYGYRITVDVVPIEPAARNQVPLPLSHRAEPAVLPPLLIKKLIALSTVDDLMEEYELSEGEVNAAFAACGLRVPKRRLASSRSGSTGRA
jgi:transcriptional regulator with XRE-family HTH domain